MCWREAPFTNSVLGRATVACSTSRARCVAIVAASPDLLRVRARTPAQMRLANALCRYVEMAAAPSGDTTSAEEAPSGTRPLDGLDKVEALTLGF